MQNEKVLSDILRNQYFAVLSSIGDAKPYTTLISFAVTGDLKKNLFLTDRKTRKYRNITSNADVSMLIDNRTNSYSDITTAFAVTVTGTAEEAEGANSTLKDLFLARHPGLKNFCNQPDTAMIVVNVQEYIIAGFTGSQKISMGL